jgi:hypothetical protein
MNAAAGQLGGLAGAWAAWVKPVAVREPEPLIAASVMVRMLVMVPVSAVVPAVVTVVYMVTVAFIVLMAGGPAAAA